MGQRSYLRKIMNEILSKVRNLLSLSDKNQNLNEAAAAFKAAQKLLSKHRLSITDVYVSEEDKEPVKESDEPLYAGARAITWRGDLAASVCKANGCHAFWRITAVNGRRQKQLLIIGRESDINTVRYMYNLIASQIEAMCASALLTNGGGKTFSNNFKLGAVDTISSRLKEATQEVEDQYKGTTALVLVKQADNEVNQAVAKLKLRKRSVSYRHNREGYAQGQAAGRRVNLSRGSIGGKNKGLLN